MSKDSPPKQGDYHSIGGLIERWKQFQVYYQLMAIRQSAFGLNFDNIPDAPTWYSLNEIYEGIAESPGGLTNGFPVRGMPVVDAWDSNEDCPSDDPDDIEGWYEMKQGVGALVFGVMWRIALWTSFEKFYQVGSGGKGGKLPR